MILVVGANGLLGSKLTKELRKKKLKFFKIDKSLKGKEKIDITDYKSLENFFNLKKIKVVINCVCEPATSKSKKNIFFTNVIGNRNLINLSKKKNIKKYIFFSTSAIWVKDYKNYVTEKTKTSPVETYGESKVQAEKDIKYSKLKSWTIFRIPMIVSYKRLGILSILFDFIINHKKIPIINDGKNLVQFIHIDDLVRFVIKSLKINEKQVYNLASNEAITLKKLFLNLIKSINSKSKLISFKDYGIIYILSFLNKINLSPLNIYHLKMLKFSLAMKTNKITKKYKMQTKIKTSTMLIAALKNYMKNPSKIKQGTEITSPLKMGIIKLFYYFL